MNSFSDCKITNFFQSKKKNFVQWATFTIFAKNLAGEIPLNQLPKIFTTSYHKNS